jgi:hypothetical protein
MNEAHFERQHRSKWASFIKTFAVIARKNEAMTVLGCTELEFRATLLFLNSLHQLRFTRIEAHNVKTVWQVAQIERLYPLSIREFLSQNGASQ